MIDDEDFRPEWTLLATLAGVDAGSVIGEADGWIAKLGVRPAARGRGSVFPVRLRAL